MDHRWAGARLVVRSGARRIAVGGREMTVAEAAQAAGLPANALRTRLRTGWPVTDALTKPLDTRGPKRRRAAISRISSAQCSAKASRARVLRRASWSVSVRNPVGARSRHRGAPGAYCARPNVRGDAVEKCRKSPRSPVDQYSVVCVPTRRRLCCGSISVHLVLD